MEPHAVVVQLERDELHLANTTAACLVDALQAGATFAELKKRILATFEVDEAKAEDDVAAFLVEAIRVGIVVEETVG